MYPSTRQGTSGQVNSKPSLTCFIWGKNDHLSYICKLGFGMKLNNLKWVPMVSCLMVSRTTPKDHVLWRLYSSYYRLMTKDPFIFTCLECHNGGSVTFSDNVKGKIIREGRVGKCLSCGRIES